MDNTKFDVAMKRLNLQILMPFICFRIVYPRDTTDVLMTKKYTDR